MALFAGSRDINLFHTINSELLNDIIQTEIGYYKFVLDKTVSNVYGESADKMFYEPIRIACLINKEDQSWSSDNFYEVDTRVENQLIFGKDPDYAISGGTIDFGDSFSILLNTHLSRVEKLNLIPLRGGRYPTINLASDGQANVFDLG